MEERLPHLLRLVEFSNGATASPAEIWTIHPMPIGGFSQVELEMPLPPIERRSNIGGKLAMCGNQVCVPLSAVATPRNRSMAV